MVTSHTTHASSFPTFLDEELAHYTSGTRRAMLNYASRKQRKHTRTKTLPTIEEAIQAAAARSAELREKPQPSPEETSSKPNAMRYRTSARERSPSYLCKVVDFPGAMSLQHLAHASVLTNLDASTYCAEKFCHSCDDRALIVKDVIPYGAIAAVWLAAWIWIGGTFPEQIDIVTSTHYHSLVLGRKVHSLQRIVHESSVTNFGHLLVTNPTRTICDIALTSGRSSSSNYALHIMHRIIASCKLSHEECVDMLTTYTPPRQQLQAKFAIKHAYETLEKEIDLCYALYPEKSTNHEQKIIY